MRRKDRALIKAHEVAEHMATIAERERIARDLHDLLGHTLSIIVLKSELAAKVADRDLGRAIREIRDVERISRNALAEVRQAVYGYRGERLEDELATARTALDAAGVALDADVATSRSTRIRSARCRSACAKRSPTSSATRGRGRCRVTLTEDGRERPPDGRGRRRRRRSGGGRGTLGDARAPRRDRRHDGARRAARHAADARRPAPAGRRARDGRVVIRILIAEDQAMVLGALSALLEIESDIEVVGEARNGAEALALALEAPPGRRRHRHRDAGHDRPRSGRGAARARRARRASSS